MNPRAWAAVFAFAMALGLALLIVLKPRPDAPEAPAVCRALTPDPAARLGCLEGLAPSILTAELAGTGLRWACQLQRGEPVAAMTLAQRECAELRARGLRNEVAQFDQLFFIPLYAAVSGLLVFWLWSHARVCATPHPRLVRGTAVALGTVALALVLLDLFGENAKVLQLLLELDRLGLAPGHGAAAVADWATLDPLARAARQASSFKWLASALWALCLGGAFHAVLRWHPTAAAPRLWRWLVVAVWVAALAAGGVMGAGAVAGLLGDSLRMPVQWLAAGMGLAMGSVVGAALAAGWGAIRRGIRYQATLPAVIPPAPASAGSPDATSAG